MPIGEKAHFGVSLTAPFGFKTEYDSNWVGRYSGIKTDLKAIDLGFAASYDLDCLNLLRQVSFAVGA